MSAHQFVLVPGAGLPGWIWDDVAERLEAAGHRADIVDFGDDKSAWRLADYAQRIMETAPAKGKVTLVGHSGGGVPTMAAASLLGDRLAGIVIVAGMVPKPGGSFVSCLGFPTSLFMRAILRILGTDPPEGLLRKGVCSDLDQERTDRIVADLRPESRRYFTDGSPPGAPSPGAARRYIHLTEDKGLPPTSQRKQAARLGGDVVELPGGHMPMLTRPEELVDALISFPTPR
ncbi:MAG: alpha/beta fold hydrolase [Thermoplasmatota archaeon]